MDPHTPFCHTTIFLFVVGYPMARRSFYTHPESERREVSNSFDLLFQGWSW
jgi:nondiscriminating aspartyl-tRNA synthetase